MQGELDKGEGGLGKRPNPLASVKEERGKKGGFVKETNSKTKTTKHQIMRGKI